MLINMSALGVGNDMPSMGGAGGWGDSSSNINSSSPDNALHTPTSVFDNNRNLYVRNIDGLSFRPDQTARIQARRRNVVEQKRIREMQELIAERSDKDTTRSLMALRKRSEYVSAPMPQDQHTEGGRALAHALKRGKSVAPTETGHMQRWSQLRTEIVVNTNQVQDGGASAQMEIDVYNDFKRSTHELFADFNRIHALYCKRKLEFTETNNEMRQVMGQYEMMISEGLKSKNIFRTLNSKLTGDEKKDGKKLTLKNHLKTHGARQDSLAHKEITIARKIIKNQTKYKKAFTESKKLKYMLRRYKVDAKPEQRKVELLQKRAVKARKELTEAKRLQQIAREQLDQGHSALEMLGKKRAQLGVARQNQTAHLDKLALKQQKAQEILNNRDERRHLMRQKVHRDAPKLRMQKMKQKLESKENTHDTIEKKMTFLHQRYRALETAFLKIRVATGVTEVSDIVYKFLTRADTLNHLGKQQESLETKLFTLTEENTELLNRLSKITVPEKEQRTRRQMFIAIDRLEEQLLTDTSRRDYWSRLYKKGNEILASMRLGICKCIEDLTRTIRSDRAQTKIRELNNRLQQVTIQHSVLFKTLPSKKDKGKKGKDKKNANIKKSAGAGGASSSSDAAATNAAEINEQLATLNEKAEQIRKEKAHIWKSIESEIKTEQKALVKMSLPDTLLKLHKRIGEALKRLVTKLDPERQSYHDKLLGPHGRGDGEKGGSTFVTQYTSLPNVLTPGQQQLQQQQQQEGGEGGVSSAVGDGSVELTSPTRPPNAHSGGGRMRQRRSSVPNLKSLALAHKFKSKLKGSRKRNKSGKKINKALKSAALATTFTTTTHTDAQATALGRNCGTLSPAGSPEKKVEGGEDGNHHHHHHHSGHHVHHRRMLKSKSQTESDLMSLCMQNMSLQNPVMLKLMNKTFGASGPGESGSGKPKSGVIDMQSIADKLADMKSGQNLRVKSRRKSVADMVARDKILDKRSKKDDRHFKHFNARRSAKAKKKSLDYISPKGKGGKGKKRRGYVSSSSSSSDDGYSSDFMSDDDNGGSDSVMGGVPVIDAADVMAEIIDEDEEGCQQQQDGEEGLDGNCGGDVVEDLISERIGRSSPTTTANKSKRNNRGKSSKKYSKKEKKNDKKKKSKSSRQVRARRRSSADRGKSQSSNRIGEGAEVFYDIQGNISVVNEAYLAKMEAKEKHDKEHSEIEINKRLSGRRKGLRPSRQAAQNISLGGTESRINANEAINAKNTPGGGGFNTTGSQRGIAPQSSRVSMAYDNANKLRIRGPKTLEREETNKNLNRRKSGRVDEKRSHKNIRRMDTEDVNMKNDRAIHKDLVGMGSLKKGGKMRGASNRKLVQRQDQRRKELLKRKQQAGDKQAIRITVRKKGKATKGLIVPAKYN